LIVYFFAGIVLDFRNYIKRRHTRSTDF
jgi:hypothetical protein